jgi:RNase P subunit RPR2
MKSFVKDIEIAYYCDQNENQEIVNYLDTLITGCVKHIPNKLAISIHEDMKYTFCENCEQNIYSHYIEDNDLMSYWSSWKVGK